MSVSLKHKKQINTNKAILSLMYANIVEIYYIADEFSKTFDRAMEAGYLKNSDGKRQRKRKFTMSDSEVITILTLFHLKQFRNLKAFYTQCIQTHNKRDFNIVSYSRFVELRQRVVVKIPLFLQLCCLGKMRRHFLY
jgi:hypothetical protein